MQPKHPSHIRCALAVDKTTSMTCDTSRQQEVTKHPSKRSLFSFRSAAATRKPSTAQAPPPPDPPRGHHRRWSSMEHAALSADKTDEDHTSWFRGRRGRNAPADQPAADDSHTIHPDLAILAQSPRPPGCLGLLQRPGSGKYPPSAADTQEGAANGAAMPTTLEQEEHPAASSQDSPRCSENADTVAQQADTSPPGAAKKVGGRRSARALSSLLPKMAFRRTDSGTVRLLITAAAAALCW